MNNFHHILFPGFRLLFYLLLNNISVFGHYLQARCGFCQPALYAFNQDIIEAGKIMIGTFDYYLLIGRVIIFPCCQTTIIGFFQYLNRVATAIDV